MHQELINYSLGFWYRSEKTSVLSELIRKTNVQEMKWIIMIILKGGTHIMFEFSYFSSFSFHVLL